VTAEPLATPVHRAYTADLDAHQFYRILQLRVDVFVVEQQCAYREFDDRDLESSTRHFWIDAGDRVLAYLRVLQEPDGTLRISRVCTAQDARGRGLAGKLMRAAVAEVLRKPSVLSAQRHAAGFYRSFGFTEVGEEYLEDGIAHVDMRREPLGQR
jgi:ElaA protein